jgi:predicted MFS family arabinose efflux permease
MLNRWIILAVLFLARTAMGFQYQSVGSISSFLIEDLGIDFAQLGILIGLFQLPGVLLSLPGGILGKRFGDKRVAVWGLGMMVLGSTVMGISGSFTLASVGRLLSGIGAVLFNVMSAKMVADWFAGREIVTAMAILVTSWPLGIAIALTSLGSLAASSSWQLVMLLTVAVCAAVLVLVTAIYRSPPEVGSEPDTKSTGFKLSRRELWLAITAGLIWGLFNVSFAVLPGFAPEYLVSTGYTIAEAGSLVSVVSWILVFSLPIGGYIAEWLDRPNAIMVTCFLGIGLAIGLIPFWSYPLVLLVALGLLFGPPPGIIVALPVEVLCTENRAPGMGVFYTCYYALMAALVPLAGLTRDLTQNPGAPLLFGGMLLMVTLLFLGLFRSLQRQ